MCPTTSTRPTTARLDASTIVRTPAARSRGPVHPKNSARGHIRCSSFTTRAAYTSPDASPAETSTLGRIITSSLSPRFHLERVTIRYNRTGHVQRSRLLPHDHRRPHPALPGRNDPPHRQVFLFLHHADGRRGFTPLSPRAHRRTP